jgi:hypothetical protein
MAKYKSLFTIIGTIGGINFYELLGQPVNREPGGGFTREAINTKASMVRVRENNSEFGNCSRLNKIFRQAIRPFYINHKFPLFHSHLMTLFTGLKALDSVNGRGKRLVYRGLETEVGKRSLVNFTYTPDCKPKKVLPFALDMDWDTYTLTIPKFHIKDVSFISGATHIGVQFGVLDFNFKTSKYQLHLADTLELPKDYAGDTLSMTVNSMPTGLGMELGVIGIRYYQEVDGEMYLLKAKNGVGISVFSLKT